MTTAQTALSECFICLIPLAVVIVGTVLFLVCKGLFGKDGGQNGR